MKEKEWRLRERPDSAVVVHLSKELGLNADLATILALRGVATFEEAKDFFRPALAQLHDPFLMMDMDKAVERIAKAWENGEKILVYGDYDVDGTTSVALLYSFLKDKGEAGFYIPDRYGEGYGLSEKGVRFAKENGYSLIITLDCGIRAEAMAKLVNELEMDLIICDHHLPGENLPEAAAILNPKQSGCEYPYKELCGCGVGFKLAQALSIKYDFPLEEVFKHLDILSVAIAADIVDMRGENRILSHFGMELINTHPRMGIRKMLEQRKGNGPLSVSDMVFTLGPKINAAGRIGSGETAVSLLISDDDKVAEDIHHQISEFNQTRRGLDTGVTEEALEILSKDESSLSKKSMVLYSDTWHKGVVGIVASRMVDRYYRPTIILTGSEEMVSGSARSVVGFDIHHAISECSDLLEQYGGHQMAAGVTLKKENVKPFQDRFEEVVSGMITEEHLTPVLDIDEEISLTRITDKFVSVIKQFAPFGPGNLNPVFRSNRLIAMDVRKVGAEDKHIKLSVADPFHHNRQVEAIAFNLGQHYEAIADGGQFDLAYTIEENHWNGRVTIQLNVKDIKMIA